MKFTQCKSLRSVFLVCVLSAAVSCGGEGTPDVNYPPVIQDLTAATHELEPGSNTTVTVNAYDPEGGELEYDWSVGEAWSVSSEGTEVTVDAPAKAGAQTEVRVEVQDKSGQKARQSISLSTTGTPNQPPEIRSLELSPNPAAPGDEATFTVDATDPDGDEMSYNWTIPEGWNAVSPGDTVQVAVPEDIDSKTVVVGVEVSDGTESVTEAKNFVVEAPNWSEVWSHSLATKPASAFTRKGGYRQQGPGSKGGEECWLQESDWNHLAIPYGDKVNTSEPFAIQVDYHRPANSPGIKHAIDAFLDPTTQKLAFAGAGAPHTTLSKSGLVLVDRLDDDTKETVVAESYPSKEWTTWRFELFPDEGRVRLLKNSNEIGEWSVRKPLQRAESFALIGSSGDSSVNVNVCWKDVRLFQKS